MECRLPGYHMLRTKTSLEPGIYFNLPAEVYHADYALSRSDIVALGDTPYTYWENSPLNPERKAKSSTDAMDYGQAFHYLLFEPKLFEKKYQVVPIDAWDINKKKIQHEDYYAMVESIKVLRAGASSNLFLSGGMPEVTIVFDDHGMRFRCRHDYFTPVCSVDFKTAYTLHVQHIKKDFDRYGYDVQMYLYKKSRQRFKEQFSAGQAHVFGNVDPAIFNKFMSSEINEFIFIFQRKTPPYPFIPLMPEDDTEESGFEKTLRAIDIYKNNMAKYGHKPWPVCDGKIKPFSMHYGIREEN